GRGGAEEGGWHPPSMADINTRPADTAIASRVVRAPCAATIELLPVSHHYADPPCPLRLLRPRRERPRRRRAVEKRDELAPPHSITSSALASSCGGTSMPSNLAVCALMTNSNLLNCKTGRSAGFAPLRICPLYMPT